MPDWVAEVKADLAKVGKTLEPNAEIITKDKPTGPASVVVVERIVKDHLPDYCIHGFASCISCDAMCYLGSETHKAVLKDTYPLCLECATKTLTDSDQVERIGNLEDHRRADGPHDD